MFEIVYILNLEMSSGDGFAHLNSSPWVRKGVSATLQSSRYAFYGSTHAVTRGPLSWAPSNCIPLDNYITLVGVH